jgi:hypothetical protein
MLSKASGGNEEEEEEEEEEASLNSPKQVMHPTNALKHALVFLKGVISEHVSMNLASLGRNSNPHYCSFRIWQNNVSLWNQYHTHGIINVATI